MNKYIVTLILALALSLFLVSSAFATQNQAQMITLSLDSSQAEVDGDVCLLVTPPQVTDGVTMVPLRFVAEAFGARVDWDIQAKRITIQQNEYALILQPGVKEALVNGQTLTMERPSDLINGSVLVPLRFLAENMNYTVSFNQLTKKIEINKKPDINQAPIADFALLKSTVAQGETVVYEDRSTDADGLIVEREWTGQYNVFFAAGEYEVSLKVQDEQGLWSAPCSKKIIVTDEINLDRLTYNLQHPIPGEPLGNVDIKVLDISAYDPPTTMTKENILVSDSPETILREGILCADALSGNNRLYFHHLNATGKDIAIFLTALNQGDQPVRLTIKRWGISDPGDAMSVGREAAYRFLASGQKNAFTVELQPGEQYVLNEQLANILENDQCLNGIFDVECKEELYYAVAAVSNKEQLSDLMALEILPRDGKHIRGSFPLPNRTLSVQLNNSQATRLIVADGKTDEFITGIDNNSSTLGRYGLLTKNMGNYGVVYKIKISTKYRMGVIFSPRGGIFKGAAAWDGLAFNLPNQGILQPQIEYAMIGIIEAGKTKTLEFIPPAGSFLPINLVFIPF